MHYKCVLYLLQGYVLVSLDWVEPMMYLCLHVTCSCIFMHTYLQDFVFLFIILLVLFWLSLSPAISLSYVSCFMAPKRKSTPSQNPFYSMASSFSDPTPSSIWFHDERAHKDFSENFSKQGIHSERQVILSDFTPICMDLILRYLSFLLAFEVRVLWSLQILYLRRSKSRG